MTGETLRWVFHDPDLDETWTVPMNPNSMTSPTIQKSLTTVHGHNANGYRPATVMGKPIVKTWEFSGKGRTVDHETQLRYWGRKRNKITITDHMGRVFEVVMRGVNVTDRKPTPRTPRRFTYTGQATLLRRLS